MLTLFGDDSEEVTPVPIPNTAVKLFSADGSWGFPPVRVGRRQAGFIWRISSAGRASALQAEGRRFDPVILHHFTPAGVAQLVEQLTCNQ